MFGQTTILGPHSRLLGNLLAYAAAVLRGREQVLFAAVVQWTFIIVWCQAQDIAAPPTEVNLAFNRFYNCSRGIFFVCPKKSAPWETD